MKSAPKPKQLSFLKSQKSDYGGDLLRTRKGRSQARPLSTRTTMHLVLRSTKATGDWSFRKPANEKEIRAILDKFSKRHGVQILSLANVGNHLHFQIKLSNRYTYKPFIRAITAAIAMAVTGKSRWSSTAGRRQKTAERNSSSPKHSHDEFDACSRGLKFWDRRPWTRIVVSFKALLNLRDYILVNQLEGTGHTRLEARWIIARRKHEVDTS